MGLVQPDRTWYDTDHSTCRSSQRLLFILLVCF